MVEVQKSILMNFYDKYISYREQSTNVTDLYNKMKKYGL